MSAKKSLNSKTINPNTAGVPPAPPEAHQKAGQGAFPETFFPAGYPPRDHGGKTMGVSSVASFLQHMASANLSAFDQQLTVTEWKILLALGEGTSGDKMTGGNSGHSYKSLRCTCELSDDALSRGLKRLVELGLIERQNSSTDQRVMHYCLSLVGQDGILRIGRAVLQQLGQLVIALSLLQTEGWKANGRM